MRVAQRRADLVPPAEASAPTPLAVARSRDWRRRAMAIGAIAAAIVLILMLIPHPQEVQGGSLSGAPSSLERAFAVTIQSAGGRGRTTGVLPAVVAVPSETPAPVPVASSSPPPVAVIAPPPNFPRSGPGGPGVDGSGSSGTGPGSFGTGSGTGVGNGSGNGSGTAPGSNPPPQPTPIPTPRPLPPVPPPGFFRFTVHVTDSATGYGVPDACVGIGSLDCLGLLKRTDASGYWTTDYPSSFRTTTFYIIIDKIRYQKLATTVVVAPVGNVVIQLAIYKNL